MSALAQHLLPIVVLTLAPILAACASPPSTPTPGLKNLQTRIAATLAAIPTAESLTPRVPSSTPAPPTPAATQQVETSARPAPASTAAPAIASGEQTYTVQAGDALSTIAVRFNTSMAAIQLLNNLDDARVVRQGQTLRIPSSKLAPDENPYWVLHVVQAGETLSMIALRYDVTLSDLLRVNNISNAALTRAGDRLVIPARGPVS